MTILHLPRLRPPPPPHPSAAAAAAAVTTRYQSPSSWDKTSCLEKRYFTTILLWFPTLPWLRLLPPPHHHDGHNLPRLWPSPPHIQWCKPMRQRGTNGEKVRYWVRYSFSFSLTTFHCACRCKFVAVVDLNWLNLAPNFLS